MDEINFYTACKADRKPTHSQSTYKVICGSVEYDKATKDLLKSEGFVLDEESKNISALNWTFADVANIYYAWRKSNNSDFLGVNQYKRYWILNDSLQLQSNTLYVPKRIWLPYTLFAHIRTNRETQPEYSIATNTYINLLTERNDNSMLNALMNSNTYIAHNMFFGHYDMFDKICSILFNDYLFPIFYKCASRLPRDNPYHARQMGFLSELVIDGILKNFGRFFGYNAHFVEMDAHV